MLDNKSWESYNDLFDFKEDRNETQNTKISSKKEETERFYTELKRDLGQESLSNESLEQNSINNSINGDDFSFEAEDEGGSFEEAADEGGDTGDTSDEPPSMDDMPDMDSDSGGDDFSDDSGSIDGGDSMDGDSGDSSSDDNGIDEIDNNKGSSLNPYTQINQKQYCIDRLNELEKSVNGAVEQYSSQYADWSEVDQLRELLGIIREQKRSFIMQQNPENLIKIGLYYDIYDKIVQNLVNKIEDRESNNKNRDH